MPAGVHLDPEYHKKYQRARRARGDSQADTARHIAKKQAILTEALGDCCAFCGSKDRLELDHIDPGVGAENKSPTHRGKNTPLKHINAQLALNNLRWLCYTCHRDHSRRQQDAAWRVFISLPLDEQLRWMV